MNFDIANSIYIINVIYIFLFVYNVISAIFGLMSNLINYKKMDEDYIIVEDKKIK